MGAPVSAGSLSTPPKPLKSVPRKTKNLEKKPEGKRDKDYEQGEN
jgi:hypothetical protein